MKKLLTLIFVLGAMFANSQVVITQKYKFIPPITQPLSISGTNTQVAIPTYGLTNLTSQTVGNGTHTTQGFRNITTFKGTSDATLYGLINVVYDSASVGIPNVYGSNNYLFHNLNTPTSQLYGHTSTVYNYGQFNKMLGYQSNIYNYNTNVLNDDIYGYNANFTNTGVIDGYTAWQVDMWHSGTANEINGAQIDYYGAGGTLGEIIGINIGKAHAWTGTATNAYGIYLDSTTNIGTSKSYAIYSTSVAPSYFKGTIKAPTFLMGMDTVVTKSNILLKINTSEKGQQGGVATLDANGRVPLSQISTAPKTITASYSVLSTDDILICNSTAAINVTLLAASGTGKKLLLKNINTGNVTIIRTGSDLIDNTINYVLMQWDAVTILDYATNKYLIF